MTTRDFNAIVPGASDAGLMAAATAGQMGARVFLMDHVAKPGKKVMISGGGRCNTTGTGTWPETFLSDNPLREVRASRYTQWDFLALAERDGIAWHEKTLVQLLCDGSARQIVAMLLAEYRRAAAWRSGSPPLSARSAMPCLMTSSGPLAIREPLPVTPNMPGSGGGRIESRWVATDRMLGRG